MKYLTQTVETYRDDKADIIMRYIDDVELEIKNGKLVVKQINFRKI